MALNNLRQKDLQTNEILNARTVGVHSEAALAGVENGVFYHRSDRPAAYCEKRRHRLSGNRSCM